MNEEQIVHLLQEVAEGYEKQRDFSDQWFMRIQAKFAAMGVRAAISVVHARFASIPPPPAPPA